MRIFTNKRIFNPFTLLWTIIIVFCVLRFYAGIVWPPYLEPDSGTYITPARHLISHGSFGQMLTRTPVYPLFLASVYKLGFDNQAVVFIQHLLGVILIMMTFMTAKIIFKREDLALLSAAILSADLLLFSYEHAMLSDFLLAFLAQAAILAFLLAKKERGIYWWPVCGFFLGVGTLCKPILMMFFLIPLMLSLKWGNGWIFNSRRAVLLLLPFLMLVFTWSGRNWVGHGYFGLTPFLGRNLMLRTENLIDYDLSQDFEVRQIYKKHYLLKLEKGEQRKQVVWDAYWELKKKTNFSEVELDRIFLRMAIGGIINHPWRYLGETILEIKNLFWSTFTPMLRIDFYFLGVSKDMLIVPGKNLLMRNKWGLLAIKSFILYSWLVIFTFFLLGVLLLMLNLIRNPRQEGIILLFTTVGYFSFITAAVEWGITRYRLPIQPTISIIAAYGILWVWKRVMRKYGTQDF